MQVLKKGVLDTITSDCTHYKDLILKFLYLIVPVLAEELSKTKLFFIDPK